MSLTRVDYENSFCQAVNTIIDAKLQGMKYDYTDRCTIIDDSKASIGKYRVDNGKAKYYAYSENTEYKKGLNVYVLIPQNDYTKDATILGKVVIENEGVIESASPLNDIAIFKTYEFKKNSDFISRGILANDPDLTIKEIASMELNINKEDIEGFTALALEVNMNTLFPYDFITSGEYGVRVTFYYGENLLGNPINFSSNNFIGNIYDSNGFFLLYNVYKLDELGFDFFQNYYNDLAITIKVSLFQNNNFKYFNNVKELFIPYLDNDGLTKLDDNITIDSLKIHFGRFKDEFLEEDKSSIVEIFPINALFESSYYYYNFGVKWFFKDTIYNDDGEVKDVLYKLFDTINSINDYFKTELKETDVVLKWFKYNEAEDENGAGVNWEDTKQFNFNCSFNDLENFELKLKCLLLERFSLVSLTIYYSNTISCKYENDNFIFENAINSQKPDDSQEEIEANGVTIKYGEGYTYESDKVCETREISFGLAKMRFCANGDILIYDSSLNPPWRSLYDLFETE